MKRILTFLIAITITVTAGAQKVYFIYLQSDYSAPFYLKMGEKIFTSSPPGYLILSGLADSTHQFLIGFPSSRNEARFTIPLKGKDRGFVIKNFENTPALFDLQTLMLIRAQTEEKASGISYRPRNDAFTSLLSKASNDSSLLMMVVDRQTETVQEPVKKLDHMAVETKSENVQDVSFKKDADKPPINNKTVKIEIPKNPIPNEHQEPEKVMVDSPAVKIPKTTEGNSAVQATNKELSTNKEYTRSVVKKHAESSTSEGFGLVFYDHYEGATDTIQILIPNPKIIFTKVDNDVDATSGMLEIKKDTSVSRTSGTGVNYPPCKIQASEADFLKLRKGMASRTSDEGMVEEARKFFKGKCFSTAQVRNLSALFLTSAGKYQFFEAAIRHVSDSDQFTSLSAELKDDYYSKRFKALVGN